jgi:stage III sporulation protein AB
MFLKIIGSFMVLAACCITGYSLSSEFTRRPGELRELQNILELFANEVRYFSTPLVDAFEKIAGKAKTPVGMFFSATASILRDGTLNASDAWNMAICEYNKKTSLAKEDLEVLDSFGKMLGKSDMEGQLSSIELTVKRLKILEREAEEKRVKTAGMYRKLSLLIGLAIIVLLF